MDATVNNGRAAEDRLHLFAKRSFFTDFLFRTPLYRKGSGNREAGDALVWLEEDLVIFQSKARSLPTNSLCLPNSDRELSWAKKNLERAVRQLDGTKRALMTGKVGKIVNERRGEVEFKSSVVRQVHGVVVIDQMVDCYDPIPFFPKRSDTTPVHVFALSEWPLICDELSTTPDFIFYLKFREQLFGRMPLPVGQEADLLALFNLLKRDPNTVPTVSDQLPDIVGLGAWFGEHFKAELAARKLEDRWSRLIDDVIDHLHDVDSSMNDVVDFMSSHPQDYVPAAIVLSKLTRLERRMVGRRFADIIRLAGEGDCDRHSATLGKADITVLLFASPEPRESRVRGLASRTVAAKQVLKTATAIGIATEAGVGTGRSYDTCYLNYPWREDATVDSLAAALFSEPYSSQTTEFPDRTDVATGSPVFN